MLAGRGFSALAFARPQTVGRTGFATSHRGLDRQRRPNPRLELTGLRPAAQPRTPLGAMEETMSQSERWHLGGNAAEVYETELVPAIFAPWAPLLVAKAALRHGERVLDVACGTGVVTRLAAEQVGTGGHVVGVDLNPGMLPRARASSLPGGTAVEWREGDAGALPFSAASFDAVFCQLGLQYFPERQQAAREMYRILKPGGRLVVPVWRALAHSPGFAALAAALERHVSTAAAAVLRASALG
jgi:SAM-dependent methyltransferase